MRTRSAGCSPSSVHAVNERKEDKPVQARIRTAARDVASLTDHATFLSGKIIFLLDATLGMINIQQNDIIKIFSVAAVVFLPPTLLASIYGMNFHHMPELDWRFGYPLALGPDGARGGIALHLFQAQRLAVEHDPENWNRVSDEIMLRQVSACMRLSVSPA